MMSDVPIPCICWRENIPVPEFIYADPYGSCMPSGMMFGGSTFEWIDLDGEWHCAHQIDAPRFVVVPSAIRAEFGDNPGEWRITIL